MKTLRTIYTALVFVGLALMTACSTDSADPINSGGDSQAGKVTLHLKLSAASPYTGSDTRATLTPSWSDGAAEENMKSWVVVVADGNGYIKAIVTNDNVADGKCISDDVVIPGLENNQSYEVYSFANISLADLGMANAKVGDPLEPNLGVMEWAMNGNGFDVNAAGGKGIPMSNEQTLYIHSDGKAYNTYENSGYTATEITKLWVVRMLAKLTFQFKNPSSTDLTINDITISDITQNASKNGGKNNIRLMPDHVQYNNELDSKYRDNVPCKVRKNDFSDDAEFASYTYTLPTPLTIPAGTTDAREVTFYVNESLAGKTSKYFIVTLNTDAGVKRYALFKDWTQIARNDHHILPISLDDYKLKFEVEAYSAIGMYPSVTDNGTILSYTCYYPEEEFHIKPTVLSASDGEVSGVDYSKMTIEPIVEDGMADADAATANAKKVFKTLPYIDTKTGLIEGVFNDDAADKQVALYKLTVPVAEGKSLEYKLLFTKDLTSFASRKHYTRKFYRYE